MSKNSDKTVQNIMTSNRMSMSRLNWTPQEESFVQLLREQNKIKSWTQISKELNKIFGTNRSGKQCRQRYMNYIRFKEQEQSHNKWTVQEDQQLFQHFLVYGTKWVQICNLMSKQTYPKTRSENSLKNRFYGLVRKICRRMSKAMKLNRIKHKKMNKQEIYLQILEFKLQPEHVQFEKFYCFEQLLKELKANLICLAIVCEQIVSRDKIHLIVSQINEFVLLRRIFIYWKKQQQSKLAQQSTDLKEPYIKLKETMPEKACDFLLEPISKEQLASFCSSADSHELNLQDIELFYKPVASSTQQDLQKEVSEILNKSSFGEQEQFID